ncbi:hypothetical protein T02_5409 [Trichinella nativa]|uniref:Uncharacterized protein n=1 Tax=Trichinella nativa TaxID=6335 RepID=A0A0V1LFA3_9BILA|nr:hypothetical protein T02_5409 [Trichinella nativa]
MNRLQTGVGFTAPAATRRQARRQAKLQYTHGQAVLVSLIMDNVTRNDRD